MVVDDSSTVRRWIRRELESLGANVETAGDGQDALARLRNEHFDLVVTDVLMPRMDGFELCRHLKQDSSTRPVPVVILSGQTSDEDVARGFDAGAAAYIPKDCSEEELRRSLADALERARLLSGRTVLVVDDSPVVREAVSGLFAGAGYVVRTAEDGKQALDVLIATEPPDLILSDLNMPRMDGAELCSALKADRELRDIPFIVMSAAADRATMRGLLRRGAAAYLAKPFNLEQLLVTAERILTDRHRSVLKERERLAMEKQLVLAGIASLIKALEARDRYTRGHSERVARIAVGIGSQMGLSAEELSELELAGKLHDIGKIGVRDSVLLKPGRLSDEEWAEIQRHPEIGAEIIADIPGLERVLDAVLYHHERMDGKGYPSGRSGHDIPLWGRMVAVADTYDAITSDRPYRDGMPQETALRIIREAAGDQLCPDCCGAFLNWLVSQEED